MDDVERAERVSKQRATLFYLMAATLLFSVMLTHDGSQSATRVAPWIVMVGLTAANLSTVGWIRPARLKRLLDDEATREHRRMAYTAGFWAALASAAILEILRSTAIARGIDAPRIVITASLVAALVSFATLELRAAR